MYATRFRHQMKELIPSPDLLRSSCSSDIKEYAHSCHPSLSLFWSYGYLFSTPSPSVSLPPYTCHHCWFFKNLFKITSSSLIWLFQRPLSPSAPPRPLLSWLYIDFIVPITVLSQSILSSLTSTPEVPVHSRIPTPTILGLSGDHHSSTLQLFLCPPSSDPYFSVSQHSFHAHHCIHWRFFTCALNASAFLPSRVMFLTKP